MSPNRSAGRPPGSPCLSYRRRAKAPRTLEPPPFPISSVPSESLLLSSPVSSSVQAQSLHHLGRNFLDALPAGLLPERSLKIMRLPRLVELAETFQTAQQWALNSLLLGLLPATPPQLLHRSVQEHGRNGSSFDQSGIFPLHESSAAEGHDSLNTGTELPQ